MTITFPELTEVEGKLNERRKQLAAIFDEAKTDTGYDLSKVKSLDGDTEARAAEVRKLNDEMTDLGKQRDDLTMLKQAAEHGADYREDGTTEPGDSSDGSRHTKTLGDAFIAAKANTTKKVEIELDIDLKATLLSTTGWIPQAVRGPRLVDFATRPISLLDQIPTVTTDQNAVVFMEETTFTNSAAETTEGVAKPQATLAFTERTSPVRKIAVFLPVSDEQLEDVPRIKALIDNRLGFMVRQRLASQILVGDGAAPNLRGLINVVGVQTQAKGADPTPDAVYKAMVLVMTTGQADPDTVVFNPLDWQDVRLLRTVDGIYIWGNPADAGPERIWGLPVVLEQGLTQNTAIVGAFNVYSELDMKKGLTVETGYNASDWTLNLQTIRAELRAAIVFYRPTAFCLVTGV